MKPIVPVMPAGCEAKRAARAREGADAGQTGLWCELQDWIGLSPEWRVALIVVWLIVAVVLGVAEMMTTTLAAGLMAVGALAAAVTGAVGGDPPLQVSAFIAVSLAGIVVIRPVALRRLQRRSTLRTGTAALVGRTGYVLEDVGPHGGRIRIGGEEWSARPYDDTSASVMPTGSTVDVLQIKGATALVHPRE
jgi:membrane protein implicated in regulation of membrane protease activity